MRAGAAAAAAGRPAAGATCAPPPPGAAGSAAASGAAEGLERAEEQHPVIAAEMTEVKAWLTEWSLGLESSLAGHQASLEAAQERLERREDRFVDQLRGLLGEAAAGRAPRLQAAPGAAAPEACGSAASSWCSSKVEAPPAPAAARASTAVPAAGGAAPEGKPRTWSEEDGPHRWSPSAAAAPNAGDVKSLDGGSVTALDARWDDTLKCTENQPPRSHVWALLSAQGWLKGSPDHSWADRKSGADGSVYWGQDISKDLRHLMRATRFSGKTDKRMQMFSVCLVAVNTVYMGIQSSVSLNSIRNGKSLPDVFGQIDMFFVILFLLELAARLYLERGAFFTGPHHRWNFFDSFLGITSLLDILPYMMNFSFLRSLKAFRAVRAARMIKSITFVRELRLMVASILCSMSSLLWAFVLLTFVVYLFSLFLMQTLEVSLSTLGRTPAEEMMQMYGTLWDSMYTLFSAISGGRDWLDVIKPFDEIWKGYRAIFVLYVIFVFFGVLNILTAIFVESAKHIAEVDRDIVIQDQISRDKSTMNEVRRIFQNADREGTGRLRADELEAVLMDDKTMKHLRVLELDFGEVEGLFQLLDIDDHNEVVIDEFVIQLMRLKGGARGLDLQTVLYENKRIFCRLSAMMRFMEKHVGLMETRLNIHTAEEFSMREILMDEEGMQKTLAVGATVPVA